MNDYQQGALRTWHKNEIVWAEKVLHAALGLSGESGEVCELVKKGLFHGWGVDRKAVLEELGDLLYYIAVMAHECDMTLQDVADFNETKLRRRYPDGFDKERSINRGDVP